MQPKLLSIQPRNTPSPRSGSPSLKDVIEKFATDNNLDNTWQEMILDTYNGIFAEPKSYEESVKKISEEK